MKCLVSPLIVLLYVVLLVGARQNVRRVSAADHLALFVIMVICPLVTLCACLLGPAWVLGLPPVALYVEYAQLAELVLFFTLLGLGIKRQKATYAMLAILLIGAATYTQQLSPIDQLTFGLSVDAAGVWGVLRATADRMEI